MEAQKGRGCSQHSQLLLVFALWVRRTQSPSPAEGTHRGAPDSHASSPPPAQPRCSGSVCREYPPGHGPLTPQGPCRLHGPGPSLASLAQQWERDWCQPAPWLPRLHQPGLQMALRSSSCCLSGLSGTPAKAVLGPEAALFMGTGVGFSALQRWCLPSCWESVHVYRDSCRSRLPLPRPPSREEQGCRLEQGCARACRDPPSSRSPAHGWDQKSLGSGNSAKKDLF